MMHLDRYLFEQLINTGTVLGTDLKAAARPNRICILFALLGRNFLASYQVDFVSDDKRLYLGSILVLLIWINLVRPTLRLGETLLVRDVVDYEGCIRSFEVELG